MWHMADSNGLTVCHFSIY